MPDSLDQQNRRRSRGLKGEFAWICTNPGGVVEHRWYIPHYWDTVRAGTLCFCGAVKYPKKKRVNRIYFSHPKSNDPYKVDLFDDQENEFLPLEETRLYLERGIK